MAQLVVKPIEFFRAGPQARIDYGTETELRNLGESLRTRQLCPVHAMHDGTMIAGFRRLKAAQLVGLPSLLAMVFDKPLTDSERSCINLTENLHRRELSCFEKWQSLEEIRRLNPVWTAKELGEFVKLEPSAVTKWLSPSKCSDGWKQALQQGKVGITDCYAVYQLPQNEQERYLEMKLAGASRDTLTRTVKRQTNPAARDSNGRSANVAIPLPSGSKVTFSGRKFSMQDLLDAIAECQVVVRDGVKRRLDTKLFLESLRIETTVTPKVEASNVDG